MKKKMMGGENSLRGEKRATKPTVKPTPPKARYGSAVSDSSYKKGGSTKKKK